MQRLCTKLLLTSAVFTAFLFGSYPPGHGLRSAPRRGVFPIPLPTRSQTSARILSPDSVHSRRSAPAARGFQPPVFFDRNDGQTDPRVLYTAHGLGYSLFLTHSGATVVFAIPAKTKGDSSAPFARHFSLAFLGANSHAEVQGEDELPGKSNYFSGSNPRAWHTRVPQFAKVRYCNLYPGVDVVFYSRHGRLEYDLEAAPGADLAAIRMQVRGASLALKPQGAIALRTGSAEFDLQRPRVYQTGAAPRLIHAAYSVHGNQLGFSLTDYDPARAVVIDPALIFATYLNSNCIPGLKTECEDDVSDVAADASGVYVAGTTTANTFPATMGGPPPTASQYSSTFILKLDPSGASILYASFLSNGQGTTSVTVDSAGSAYISGLAGVPSPSGVPSFPLTQGVFSGVVPPNSPAAAVPFATKLSPDGASILYSTLLQQPTPNGTSVSTNVYTRPAKIAVDAQGALYITGSHVPSSSGSVTSVWMPLPATQGAFQTTPGKLFVMKLTPSASGLEYSTYFDGITPPSGDDYRQVTGIAVDANGDAFLSGTAGSGFPTTSGAYEPTNLAGPLYDSAFVFELDPTGSGPIYSTYFGSSAGGSFGAGIAIDSQDEAILVSNGDAPPVTINSLCGAASGPPEGGNVAKFNATGSALVYSTRFCDVDTGTSAVAVDSKAAAYVTGSALNPASIQQILLQPIKSYFEHIPGTNTPEPMRVALKLDASGNLLWSTFLGSSGSGNESRIALDSSGALYLLDYSTDFPTTPGAVGLPSPGSSALVGEITLDFLLKIAPSLGEPVGLTTPTSVTFPTQNVGTSSASVDVQAGNYGDASMTPTISVTGDFSETDNCSTPVPPGDKCDVNVTFTPTAGGTRTGSLNFNFGGEFPTESVPLTGSGTQPAVSLSPASLSFGEQAIGTTSGAEQVTLTNTGTGPLTITSIQTSSEFAQTNTCGGPVAGGSSCTIQVTFTPTASGTQTGTLTITDDAPGSPQAVSLSGNQPPTFALSSSSSSSSATVTAGQTASYSFNLTPGNGFTGSVNFTCTGAPSESSCSVSPNPANITAASPAAITASVSTQAAGTLGPSAPYPPFPPIAFELLFAALALLFSLAMCTPAARRRLSWKTAPAALAVLFLLTAAAACGGGSSQTPPPPPPPNPGTPPGTYTITVTGTSGSISQSIQLTLKVN